MNRLKFSALALLIMVTANADSGEIQTTLAEQTGLAVTIYNTDLALVKDQRHLTLSEGELDLAFREVSAQIRPDTVIFTSQSAPGSLSVIEQNFDFDLLSPQSLLEAYVGEAVNIIKQHPTTGVETSQPAQVLSTQGGTVLKIGDHIETGLAGRLSFPSVPDNFRDRPTLVMKLNNQAAGKQDVELSYLTGGLSWEANYVAQLSADEKQLDLNGWVTLTNNSGTAYPNARVQLVAGDVNVVQPRVERRFKNDMMVSAMAAPAPQMKEEGLFDYHLYSLGRQTTLANNQTKQVALLSAAQIPVEKSYLLRGQSWLYQSRQPSPQKDLKIKTELRFKNDKASHLGHPLPKGTIRLYKNDSSGGAQFIGEDAIDHTPEDKMVTLSPGNAFDVTAERVQRVFKQQRLAEPYHTYTDTQISITLFNAKDEAVTVRVEEPIPGEWNILESQNPAQRVGNMAIWEIEVAAKGEATLTFRVETRM